MRSRPHLHLLQARYWESPYAIETSRLLIDRKCARTIRQTLNAHGLCTGIGVLHAPIDGREVLVPGRTGHTPSDSARSV